MRVRPLRQRTPMGPQRYHPNPDLLARLEKAVQYTANGSKNFVLDLIHKHYQFGGWTINQEPYVTQMLDKARENYRRLHPKDGSAARPVDHLVSIEGMKGLMRRLRLSTQKKPALVFDVGDGTPIKVTLSADKGFNIYDDEDGEYIGKVRPDGTLVCRTGANMAVLADGLSRCGEAYLNESARDW